MALGTVYNYKNFKFSDESLSDGVKLLVQLSTPKDNENILFCLTTSQAKIYRSNNKGCHNNYYKIDACEDCFPKNTWILFEIYSIEQYKLTNAKLGSKVMSGYGNLKKETLENLLLCMIKSEDISQANIKILNQSIIENQLHI